jgi:uncharacterized protein (TIGR02246 family)
MKTKFVLSIVSIALLSSAQGETVNKRDREAKAVNAAFDQYVLGWQTGDINLLASVYAHDAKLTAYWPDPTRPSRLESWTTVRANLKEVFDLIHRMNLEFDERQIEVFGGVAFLTSHWTWHQPSGPFFEHGRATFIFKKEDGRWRILHEHSSVTPFIPGQDSEFVAQETSH